MRSIPHAPGSFCRILAAIGILLVTWPAAILTAATVNGTFNQTTVGPHLWENGTNWVGGNIASGVGAIANFTSGTSGTITVSTTTATPADPRVIGQMEFGGSHAWTLSGTNPLSLEMGTGTPSISLATTSTTVQISSNIQGTQGLNATGTSSGNNRSTLTLSGSNSYTGITKVGNATSGTALTLIVTSASALGASGAGNHTEVTSTSMVRIQNTSVAESFVTSGGQIHGSGTAEISGGIQFTSTARLQLSASNTTFTISGSGFSGSSKIEIDGNNVANSKFIVSGASTHTGTTELLRGTLQLAGGDNRLSTGVFTIGTQDAATLDLNGQNQQFSRIINSYTDRVGNRTITNTASALSSLTLNGSTDGSYYHVNGAGKSYLTGNLELVKQGTFSQTLAAVNTYTGKTTITAGTLILHEDATKTFFVGANGVVNGIGGTGGIIQLDGQIIFDLTGAVLNPGNSWTILGLTSGLSAVYGTDFAVSGFAKSGNIWSYDTLRFSELTGILSVIPEPSASALLLIAGLGWSVRRLRRKSE